MRSAPERIVTIGSGSPAGRLATVVSSMTQVPQPTGSTANPAALALYEGVNACQNPDQLDAMVRLIWERHLADTVNDDEASYLVSCIERRRPLSRRTSAGKFAAIGKLNGRISRFLPRQRPDWRA